MNLPDLVLRDVSALVFDLDGTLVDTFTDLAASINHLREGAGRPPLSLEEVKGNVGMGVTNLVRTSLDLSDPAPVRTAVDDFLLHYSSHMLDSTVPYPGVEGGLERLHGLPMAVLSNKPQAQTRGIVTDLRLVRHFAYVFGGDSFPAMKPDPAALKGTLKALGASPERTLMVGDSPVDRDAARAAGVRIALVTTGLVNRDQALALHPDLVIDDLLELTR